MAPKNAKAKAKPKPKPKAPRPKPAAKPKTQKKAARSRTKLVPREVALATFAKLAAHHHDAHCELDHRTPFELICATVLSAQSTDVMVNKVTPGLFSAYPDAAAMAKATPLQIEALVNRLGMFRQKSKSLVGLAQKLVADHGGEVPKTLAELVKLPGVGRKTANVVLGVAFGTPEGVVVDTHVQRISQRLGWTKNTEPVEIEQDLMKLLPRADWDRASHVMIFHGRRICDAQKPNCRECPVADLCPNVGKAESVGRKPPRTR